MKRRGCEDHWGLWGDSGRQEGQAEVGHAEEKEDQTALTWGRGWRALALGQLGPWHWLQAPGLKSFKSLLKRFLRHQMALKNQYFDDLSARESETYGSNCPQIIHTLKMCWSLAGSKYLKNRQTHIVLISRQRSP